MLVFFFQRCNALKNIILNRIKNTMRMAGYSIRRSYLCSKQKRTNYLNMTSYEDVCHRHAHGVISNHPQSSNLGFELFKYKIQIQPKKPESGSNIFFNVYPDLTKHPDPDPAGKTTFPISGFRDDVVSILLYPTHWVRTGSELLNIRNRPKYPEPVGKTSSLYTWIPGRWRGHSSSCDILSRNTRQLKSLGPWGEITV